MQTLNQINWPGLIAHVIAGAAAAFIVQQTRGIDIQSCLAAAFTGGLMAAIAFFEQPKKENGP